MIRRYLALCAVLALVVGLSHIDAATSRLKVKSSPLGRHVRTSEHHTGKVRSASCAGVSKTVGAARFGAVKASGCKCGANCQCGPLCDCN